MQREKSIPLTVVIPIKDRNGNVVGEKEVASFAGLLARAHEEGLVRVETHLAQAPAPENGDTAVVTAVVETGKGTFTGIGDANPGNVNRRIAPHAIRMAETRAVSRALRLAVNIGLVSLEELGGDDAADALVEEEAPSRLPRHQPAVTRPAPARRNQPQVAQHGAASGMTRRTTPVRESQAPDARTHWRAQAGDVEPPMSEAQRRYLFRLAADLGIEGEDAHGFLLEALHVNNLDDVPRPAASALIDRLKVQLEAGEPRDESSEGQGNGSAAPF